MGVTIDERGRRTVTVSVDVPGDRETVWNAIATGPGVTSWMAPTEIDERVGGELVCRFGPGMEAHARIVAWNPPESFHAEADELGPDAPKFETEWTVEDLGDGRCRVTVLHAIATDSDQWDGNLTGVEVGWPGFFRVLQLYLTHFPGRHGRTLATMRPTRLDRTEAWSRIQAGLADAESRPPFAATVLHTHDDGFDEQALLLTEPTDGLALLSCWSGGGPTINSLTMHLFGDDAEAVIERDQRLWDLWLTDLVTDPS